MSQSTYATGIGLDIDPPLGGFEVERLEGTLLAQDLELVDVLVTTVVTRVGKTLRVLVCEDGAIGLHGGTTRQVLKAKVVRFESSTSGRQRTNEPRMRSARAKKTASMSPCR